MNTGDTQCAQTTNANTIRHLTEALQEPRNKNIMGDWAEVELPLNNFKEVKNHEWKTQGKTTNPMDNQQETIDRTNLMHPLQKI